MLALRAWLKLVIAALGMYGLARQVVRVGPAGAALAAVHLHVLAASSSPGCSTR